MNVILLVLLILLLIAALPQIGWGPAHYGYYPSGAVGVALLVLVILLLMGRI